MIYSINVYPCVHSQISVVVKKCDDIYHFFSNECLDFIAILQCLLVLEEKYCRRYSFSREVYFLLKSDNYAMKIFNLLSVLEFQGG